MVKKNDEGKLKVTVAHCNVHCYISKSISSFGLTQHLAVGQIKQKCWVPSEAEYQIISDQAICRSL